MKPILLFAALLLLTPPAIVDTPLRYRLAVLPLEFWGCDTIDDSYYRAGINTRGQITGMAVGCANNPQERRAAFWQRGRVHFLDTAVVKRSNEASNQDYTSAAAINAYGDAVGEETVTFSGAYSDGGSSACAVVKGKWFDLGPFPPGSDSEALGLNDACDIVGDFWMHCDSHYENMQDPPTPASAFTRFAFLWERGRVKRLWPGRAYGINNKREIVGSGGGGLLWRRGKITLLKMQPTAINERTEIAGNLPLTDDTGRACLWRRGTLTRLSAKISHAYALNDRGQVVGEIGDPSIPTPFQAVLWRSGRTYDLNHCVSLPKGWRLEKALGINDHGWIIGEGSVYKTPKDTQAAKTFTFLLTPR